MYAISFLPSVAIGLISIQVCYSFSTRRERATIIGQHREVFLDALVERSLSGGIAGRSDLIGLHLVSSGMPQSQSLREIRRIKIGPAPGPECATA
jgi:hypothetical protein